MHPLQTQAVTYIVQRYESLMGMFFLLTLYTAIRAMTSPHARGWTAISVAMCVLALGSKEVAVSAPILVLLYDRTFVTARFGSRSASVCRFIWAWLLAAGRAAALLRGSGGSGVFAARKGNFGGFGSRVKWYEYALSQPGVILHYLRLCLWPRGQCFDYGWPVARSVQDILPPLAIIVAMLCATIWGIARGSALGFLGVWFFLILTPVVQCGADHRFGLRASDVFVIGRGDRRGRGGRLFALAPLGREPAGGLAAIGLASGSGDR